MGILRLPKLFGRTRQRKISEDNLSGNIAPLKILYFSCHEILEYDDLKMFTGAGHRVFSVGSYADPSKKDYQFRSPLPQFFDQEFWQAFNDSGGILHAKRTPRAFVNMFDVIVSNHHPVFVRDNLANFGEKPVIVRTLGQSTLTTEAELKEFGERIYIVRYSYREVDTPGFAKTDAVIYFSKDPEDFGEWKGGDGGLTFHNGFEQRSGFSYPDLAMWREFHAATGSRLYGAWNEAITQSSGEVSASRIPQLYSTASYYFYVYSQPASYSLSFMEALMAGVPILAPSTKLVSSMGSGTDDSAWRPHRYEVPHFLRKEGGVLYDSIPEAITAAQRLTRYETYARSVSAQARKNAVANFGTKSIARQWNDLFQKII
jgi:hypothetical protein